MKPISNDLRRRIIEAIRENEDPPPEIAERYRVSLLFVAKRWHRFRQTGSYEAKPEAGGGRRALKDAEQWIGLAVKAQPAVRLAALVEKAAAQTGNPAVSLMTMSAELRRLQLPRKKSSVMPPGAISSACGLGVAKTNRRAAWKLPDA